VRVDKAKASVRAIFYGPRDRNVNRPDARGDMKIAARSHEARILYQLASQQSFFLLFPSLRDIGAALGKAQGEGKGTGRPKPPWIGAIGRVARPKRVYTNFAAGVRASGFNSTADLSTPSSSLRNFIGLLYRDLAGMMRGFGKGVISLLFQLYSILAESRKPYQINISFFFIFLSSPIS
jgi:hypothetical protein